MEISKAAAAVACLLLLGVVAAAAGALPAAGAAKAGAAGKGAAVAAVSTVQAWVDQDAAVGIILQAEAAPLMMMLAAAAAGDYEVHRRVLQTGEDAGYRNEALVANHQRCIVRCPPPGGSYTVGRGNKCIYQNPACTSPIQL